jgi:hypothetical protein
LVYIAIFYIVEVKNRSETAWDHESDKKTELLPCKVRRIHMKYVIAFDVSMGKSYMVIYNALKNCVFEGEINHYRTDFEVLKEKIDELSQRLWGTARDNI